MIADVLSQAGAAWQTLTLILFFAAFAGIVIWTYRGRSDRFARESRLPLEDDTLSFDPETSDTERPAHDR